MNAVPRHRHYRPAALRGQVVLWLAACVFLLQMFAAAVHHDHEVAAKSPHCVSCALHAQPHAAPPDTVLPVAPFRRALLHALFTPDVADRIAPRTAWLLPPPHAPPVFLFA